MLELLGDASSGTIGIIGVGDILGELAHREVGTAFRA